MSDPFQKIAENKIKEAMEKGEFDNLPGKGKPLRDDSPPPYVSKETWDMMKLLKNAGVFPKEVELLREIELLHKQIGKATNDDERSRLTKEVRKKEADARLRIEELVKKK